MFTSRAFKIQISVTSRVGSIYTQHIQGRRNIIYRSELAILPSTILQKPCNPARRTLFMILLEIHALPLQLYKCPSKLQNALLLQQKRTHIVTGLLVVLRMGTVAERECLRSPAPTHHSAQLRQLYIMCN